MFFLCRAKLTSPFAAVLLWVILATSAVLPANAEPFRICAEPENLPLSQESTHSGFEIEAAELLAKDMGRTLEVKWIPQRDHAYFRQTLGNRTCDALMSVPSQFPRLTKTIPWYRTGFVFVTRAASAMAPKSFDDVFLKNAVIGIPVAGLGDTPPVTALARRELMKNVRVFSIYEPQKMISAVVDKDIDVAVAWGPFAGWFAQGKDLLLQSTPDLDGETPLAFDISIGLRSGDVSMKENLDRALKNQHEALAMLIRKWHIPLRSP